MNLHQQSLERAGRSVAYRRTDGVDRAGAAWPGGRALSKDPLTDALRVVLMGMAGLLLLTGCHRAQFHPDLPRIATTTSYLEAVAFDLLGNDISVVRLAEPGTCPGHFDIRLSQVEELRRCRVLLRFDFQKAIDERLSAFEGEGPQVAEIAPGGGMNLPASYLAACRQAADCFVKQRMLTRAQADERLELIAARLESLAQATLDRAEQAGATGRAVLASGHQRDFCEWLGLEVLAVFRAADTASVREIEAALAAGKAAEARLVIANRPEGRRTADALGERLGATVVVFENFPDPRHGRLAFDAMLSGNVDALLEALAR